MLRVSSRQRLVSWDAFDATAHDDSDNTASEEDVLDDVHSEYQSCVDDTLSPSSSWTTVGELDIPNSIEAMAGQKRERNARCEYYKVDRALLMLQRNDATLLEQSPPAVIVPTSSDDEEEEERRTNPTLLQLQQMAVDTQLHIMSYLDLSSLRLVMATSHTTRNLLMSKDACFLWTDWIHRLWPKLIKSDYCPSLALMDSMKLPTAVGQFEEHDINVSLILSLAATRRSSCIDVNLFQPPVHSHYLRSMRRWYHLHHLNNNNNNTLPAPLFVMYEQQRCISSTTNTQSQMMTWSIVEFRGEVGTGDRCVRAKEPLARPTRRVVAINNSQASNNQIHNSNNNNEDDDDNNYDNYMSFLVQHSRRGMMPLQTLNETIRNYRRHPLEPPPPPLFFPPTATTTTTTTYSRPSLLDMLCRGNKSVSVIESNYRDWKPFVTPHVVVNPSSGKILLDMTPRMISYFEVSILNRNQNNDDDDETTIHDTRRTNNNSNETTDRHHPRHHLHQPVGRSECVAVGIASQFFDVYSRMPGWDSFSFGYHGDDGGIFHASGVMLRPYGPCFGVGDTVGCGVDYTNGGIFFTLNSNFLGYAWTGISESWYLQQDLYPVIGVDTYAPISCNFGERPFEFDLSTFLRQHAGGFCRSSSSGKWFG